MAELLIAEAAEEDYTQSLLWYAERSKRAAEGFETEFVRAPEAISENPERYPLCDDRHRFCRLKRFPFHVLYRKVAQDQLLIVAVAHTSRRPGYWRQR